MSIKVILVCYFYHQAWSCNASAMGTDGMARSKFESSVGMSVNKTRYVMINVRLLLLALGQILCISKTTTALFHLIHSWTLNAPNLAEACLERRITASLSIS